MDEHNEKETITICTGTNSLLLFAHCRSMSNVVKHHIQCGAHFSSSSNALRSSLGSLTCNWCSYLFRLHFLTFDSVYLSFTLTHRPVYFVFFSLAHAHKPDHIETERERQRTTLGAHTMSINLEWMDLYLCALGDGFMAKQSYHC